MIGKKLVGAFIALAKAGLTGISGAATTFTTGVVVPYAINGKAYSKAAVAGGTTPVTDFVTGAAITLLANFGTVVVWALDAAGNVRVIKGSTEPLDAAGNFLTAPQFPNMPDTVTAFAYTVHKAGSTASGTFTFGVSNWNTTGTSHAVQDVITLPDRPQIA
jgi:hypothetical protein